MKKVLGGIAALAVLFVVASCGGVSEDALIGKWTPDPASVEVEFGDNVPSKYEKEFKAAKKEMVAEAGDDAKKMVLEFKEGGKFTVGAEGQTMDGKWSLDGEDLTLSMDMMGQEIELTAQVEMDGDKMTATITGEEIMKRVKKMGGMAGEIKEMTNGEDPEKMAEGTSISISFNKK